ncbi:MAG: hypothetical protein M3R00_10870 [Pseudomonadota bacterium]|nr:hypothetical protein [Pseudomonadota bacterium]
MPTSFALYHAWFKMYYGTLLGAITITASLSLFINLRRKRLRINTLYTMPTSTLLCMLGIGFLGGVSLQPGVNVGGLVVESMIPLVLVMLTMIIRYLETIPVSQRTWLLVGITVEYMLSRFIHSLMHAILTTPPNNGNLQLKIANKLVFIRDALNTSMVVPVIIALTALLLYVLLTSISRSAGRPVVDDQ